MRSSTAFAAPRHRRRPSAGTIGWHRHPWPSRISLTCSRTSATRAGVSGGEPQHLLLARPVARQLADGAALGHDHDAVGQRQHLGQVGGDDQQGHAAGRRGRAGGGRSRRGRRRRRRASARRRSGGAAPAPATWRAAPSAGCRPTGCRRSGATLGVAMRSSSTKRSASASALRFGEDAPDETLREHRRRRCCRRCPCRGTGRPSLRSSGTMPMPAAMRVPRALRVDRPAVDPDRARRSPARAPKIASQNSLRPEPIRPARQTISPARTRERGRAHERRRARSLGLEHDARRRCAPRRRARRCTLAADHQPDQLVGRWSRRPRACR